jgi:hypothetical protein
MPACIDADRRPHDLLLKRRRVSLRA